jgi:hypothetical protein
MENFLNKLINAFCSDLKWESRYFCLKGIMRKGVFIFAFVVMRISLNLGIPNVTFIDPAPAK